VRSAHLRTFAALANSFDNKDLEASLAYYFDDQDALFYEDDTFELKVPRRCASTEASPNISPGARKT
jgi:hypothetical protein